ncbi:MAG: DUF502 domain-containing protein [Bacteroidales bacterium]
MVKKLVSYFLQGLLYIAPFGVTAYIIYLIFNFVDGLLQTTLESVIGLHIPGLGILIILLFLIAVGYFGQTVIATPLKSFFRRMIHKVPVLEAVYSAFNDLINAFVGKEKKFNKPVLVLINPTADLYKLGFLTEEDLSLLFEKEKVAVYFPHSYNFSGELFIVPRKNVRPLKINSAQVMKFIVSAGVAGWDSSKVSEPEEIAETVDKELPII